jgi:L-threonylcarbamoyladenylate synthase
VSTALDAIAALRAGDLVVLPTDTVYGIACTPGAEGALRALSEVKSRPPGQPLALLAGSVERLVELVPELAGESERVARALLPGPYTLVFRNPALRLAALTGDRPHTIGVRVPQLSRAAADVLAGVPAVAATSANLHGGPDPGRVEDVPVSILDAVSVVLDAGELPGVPSTVLDLTGEEPSVLREGAVPEYVALAAVADALSE